MLFGYLFCYFYKQRDKLENSLNDYLYYFSLPLTIFEKLISSNFNDISINLFLLNSLPIIFVLLMIYFVFKLNIITHSFARTLMVTSILGNVVYLGFAFVEYFYGEEMIPSAVISVSIQNLIIFTVGVYFVNIICNDGSCLKIGIKKAFLNPIFLSTFFAILFKLVGLKISYYFSKPIKHISSTTIPLALFLIGMSLYSKKINIVYIKKILIISFFKLFFLPFIVAAFIYIIGYSTFNFKIIFILHTMPVAVACYAISKDFELEKDVVAGSIFFTTLFYMFLWWVYISIAEKLF